MDQERAQSVVKSYQAAMADGADGWNQPIAIGADGTPKPIRDWTGDDHTNLAEATLKALGQ